jgi:hypothetical protein
VLFGQAAPQVTSLPLETVAITAGAVVLAAVVAAVAAHHRQKSQIAADKARQETDLEAEQRRLEAQLGAEHERLVEQLRHDYGVADQQERRRREERVRQVCADADRALAECVRELDRAEADLGPSENFDELLNALEEHERRLAAWVGQSSLEVGQIVIARTELRRANDVLREARGGGVKKEPWHGRIREARSRARSAQRQFLDLVSKRVGVRE